MTAENSKLPETDESATVTGKKGPTPKRKEAEAKNIRPLVAGSIAKDPAARKAARAEAAEQRAKAREGMLAGDERYLGIRDRGPQRKFVRDLVDSQKFTVGELLVPTMVLVLVLSMIDNLLVQYSLVAAMWALMAGIIFDGLRLATKVKREAAVKFGVDRVEKGLGWYAAVRASQMRPMRLPKPQVPRGGKK